MPTTPNFALTYPASGDHVRLCEWFQELATDIDNAFVRPLFRARRAAAQAIANASETALQWDAEDVDTHNGHDLVTNPSRYTCPAGFAGYWQVSAAVGFPNNITGRRGIFLRKNGTAIDGGGTWWVTGVNGTHATVSRTTIVQLAVGDYIEATSFQESGGSLSTTTAGPSQPNIDILFLRP
jgi:hypothetical protein